MRYLLLVPMLAITACGAEGEGAVQAPASFPETSQEPQAETTAAPERTANPAAIDEGRGEAESDSPMVAEPTGAVHPPSPDDVADGSAIPVSTSNVSTTSALLGENQAPTYSASVGSHGRLTVHIEGFSYFCDPTPSFEARREGNTIILRLVQPDAVTRCISRYSMTLDLGSPDMSGWLRQIAIQNDGGEVARFSVSRERGGSVP